MSYLKQISIDCICFAVLLLLPGMLQARKFESMVDYRHVGLHDTIKLTIIYEGDPDSIGNFKVDLAPFTIVFGPSTSSSTDDRMVDGRSEFTHRLKVVYYLRADTLGKYALRGASLITDDGDTLRTAPVAMEVSPRPFRKTDRTFFLTWEAGDDPFEDISFGSFDAPRTIGNKINMAGAPFVLITGWTYQPLSLSADSSLQILTTVDSFMQSRPDVLLMDHKVIRELPLLYYTLSDTTGITGQLLELYKVAGKEAHPGIVFVNPRQWTNKEEARDFVEPHYIWRAVYMLLANLAGPHFDPSKKKTVEVRCFFKDLQNMDQFIGSMQQQGYKTGAGKRKGKAKGAEYYVDIVKPVPMIDQEMYATITAVALEINKPEYVGRIGRISIADPPKRK